MADETGSCLATVNDIVNGTIHGSFLFPRERSKIDVGRICYPAGMGKLAKSLVQYTIRGVPAEVDHALRVKAAQRKQSLNRVVLDELTRALIGRPVKTDFSDLVGKWAPDPGFDKVIASQRQIDADKWK